MSSETDPELDAYCMPESDRCDTPVPADTVTFMFTDIEGSTALWEHDGARMSEAVSAHDELARSVVESRHGSVVKTTGDGIHAAFDDPLDALAAATDLQLALADPAVTGGISLRVRCGLHAGIVERRNNDYFGSAVNRAARIMNAAHGGQVLLSRAVVDRVGESLPETISLCDLGKIRLKDLATPEHVYQVMHPRLRREFPVLRSLEATPNNLPQQSTRFIGRENELAELRRLLARSRTLTIAGAGGCGKTRIALQVAADSLEQFPDGVWLVELAPLSDPGHVPQAVASVLRTKEESGRPINETLYAHLKDKRQLLLLDNCEHLVAACAKLTDALMRHCPRVTILATSREALRIDGEQSYRLPSLSLPSLNHAYTAASIAQAEAVQLFTDRALLARTEFRFTDQNASTVASICCRLDGIPLALELAAARLRSLSVEEIDRKLDQRFHLLTDGLRTALPRQQTLRSLIDWSYELLPDIEQLMLQQLAVFAGGWTLTAAERVCAGEKIEPEEVAYLLASLCDKSLVTADSNNGRYRYRLLDTVRHYAQEKLAESGSGETVRTRHLEYFFGLAQEARTKPVGAEQLAWLSILEEEHDNLRASLGCSFIDPEASRGLQLCWALAGLWTEHAHFTEGREWCARMLAKPGAEQRTLDRARVLDLAGTLTYFQGDYAASKAMHEESLAIAREQGDRKRIASSLGHLGTVAFEQGDYASARAFLEENLVVVRELGFGSGVAVGLNNLGNVSAIRGDIGSARVLYEESLAIANMSGDRASTAIAQGSLAEIAIRQGNVELAETLFSDCLAIARDMGNRYFIARALNGLGETAFALRDFARSHASHSESLKIAREIGDRDGVATSLGCLGKIAREQQDYGTAKTLHQESCLIRHELGNKPGIAFAMEELATVAAGVGNYLRAACIWGIAAKLRDEIQSPLVLRDRSEHEQRLAASRRALGDDVAFDRAWHTGRLMSFEQAIEFAFNETVVDR
jgi:predicted ATPase/class 3 adenylate cyclase